MGIRFLNLAASHECSASPRAKPGDSAAEVEYVARFTAPQRAVWPVGTAWAPRRCARLAALLATAGPGGLFAGTPDRPGSRGLGRLLGDEFGSARLVQRLHHCGRHEAGCCGRASVGGVMPAFPWLHFRADDGTATLVKLGGVKFMPRAHRRGPVSRRRLSGSRAPAETEQSGEHEGCARHRGGLLFRAATLDRAVVWALTKRKDPGPCGQRSRRDWRRRSWRAEGRARIIRPARSCSLAAYECRSCARRPAGSEADDGSSGRECPGASRPRGR